MEDPKTVPASQTLSDEQLDEVSGGMRGAHVVKVDGAKEIIQEINQVVTDTVNDIANGLVQETAGRFSQPFTAGADPISGTGNVSTSRGINDLLQ